MAQFVPDVSKLALLKGKVVVLTGGSSGIGAATAEQLALAGAHVFSGDVNEPAPGHFESVSAAPASDRGSIEHIQCDISKYADVYKLFCSAYDRFGRVDHAIANAGLLERGKWFDAELTVDSVAEQQQQETTRVLDVNVYGTSYFARIAVVFLRDSREKGRTGHPSLTLLASVASFRESPGMPMYQASKHAILGLMRAMRGPIYERDHIRVNCICPGLTQSGMTEKIFHLFRENGLATQTSSDVAKMILGLLVEDGVNGKSVYVEGATGWEFEDSAWNEMSYWLGETPTEMLKRNAKFVSSGGITRALEAQK